MLIRLFHQEGTFCNKKGGFKPSFGFKPPFIYYLSARGII